MTTGHQQTVFLALLSWLKVHYFHTKLQIPIFYNHLQYMFFVLMRFLLSLNAKLEMSPSLLLLPMMLTYL